MQINFHAFGIAHLAILGMIPLIAGLLAMLQRRVLPGRNELRFVLAALLLASFGTYYGSFAAHGEAMFPGHVPLELCDLSLLLMILVLLTLNAAMFDVVYYWALAGATMALLTPNLSHTTLFMVVVFFTDHGLTVVAVLFLLWSRLARPRRGSVMRAMIAVNGIALLVGAFDFRYKTDYMFLRAKPATVSLLDVLGPWPWYIVLCEGVGLGLFALLYLPFWKSRPRAETAIAVPISR